MESGDEIGKAIQEWMITGEARLTHDESGKIKHLPQFSGCQCDEPEQS